MATPKRTLIGACEINTGVFVPASQPPAFQGEAGALMVQVAFTLGGAAYTIPSDVTPMLYLYYDAQDAQTIARAMDKSGSTATATLTAEEQSIPGTPMLIVELLSGSNTIVAFGARVSIQKVSGVQAVIGTIPADILAQAIAATAAANAGAANANTAADAANQAAANASDHSRLSNRDIADQHPIAAIEGLQAALDSKGDMFKSTYDTDGNGVVGDAEKLGGNAPSYYAGPINDVEPGGDGSYSITASDIPTSDSSNVQAELDRIDDKTASDIPTSDGSNVQAELDSKLDKPTPAPTQNAFAVFDANGNVIGSLVAVQNNNVIDLGDSTNTTTIGVRAYRTVSGIAGDADFYCGSNQGKPAALMQLRHGGSAVSTLYLSEDALVSSVPLVGNPVLIWSGAAAEGDTINILGLSRYSVYAIRAQQTNTVIFAMRTILAGYITGGGLRQTSTTDYETGYSMSGTFSGDNLTITTSRYIQHNANGTNGPTTATGITQIWGII